VWLRNLRNEKKLKVRNSEWKLEFNTSTKTVVREIHIKYITQYTRISERIKAIDVGLTRHFPAHPTSVAQLPSVNTNNKSGIKRKRTCGMKERISDKWREYGKNCKGRQLLGRRVVEI
jgi:hypothetical protein